MSKLITILQKKAPQIRRLFHCFMKGKKEAGNKPHFVFSNYQRFLFEFILYYEDFVGN